MSDKKGSAEQYKAAFPQVAESKPPHRTPEDYGKGGVTKREYFAAQILPKVLELLVDSPLTETGIDIETSAAIMTDKAIDAYFRLQEERGES